MKASTVDFAEIEKFSRMAEEWWDPAGKFKPLHQINPVRLAYIRGKVDDGSWKVNGEEGHQPPATNHQPLQGCTLLDIGCGGGLISEPFARLGAQVTGIDASEKNIKIASLHAEQSGLTIDYRCSTAEDLYAVCSTQHAALFDVVLALEIVEHVANVEAFVEACAKLVKPGGLLIMSTLNRTAKSYALSIIGAEYILRWLPIGTHDWKKFLKPHELQHAIERNGLCVSEKCGLVMNPLTFAWRMEPKDLSVNYMVVAKKLA